MPGTTARTIKQGRAGIVRAMLLLVRGYNAAKNLVVNGALFWPVTGR